MKFKSIEQAKKQLALAEQAAEYLKDKRRKVNFSSPSEVRPFVRTELTNFESEKFLVVFLDNRHNLITSEIMFHGTIDSSVVYPREVVKRCMELNAAAVMFAHNHPSGNPDPSQSDVDITRRLIDALKLVEVRVLDHFIVGEGKPVSLAEQGKI